MEISINNYLRHLPMENPSLIGTIPLAILVLGFLDFFLQFGRKFYNFLSKSKATSNKYFPEEYFKIIHQNKNIQQVEKLQNDGKLSINKQEVVIALKSLGIFVNPNEDQDHHARFEKGLMSVGEIISIFEENMPSLDEVKQAFDVFDHNKDGFIDPHELQRILVALGFNQGFDLENCKKMIGVFDANNDGRLDFDEFVKFLESVDF